MRYILTLCLIVMTLIATYAQSTVQGSVLDEDQQSLIGATVVLLEPVDSSMVAFAISDADGLFTIDQVGSGSYVLQISFVSYGTMTTPVEIGAERKNHLGSFSLTPTTEILQEITVKAEHIPMGVIGDTISYNAAAFKTKPGATVEDLLKKLPGVEVQRDGSIKAMGEDVNNVLVDGKEFFGDDPQIATKNLDAEAVEKVQVFDKKSDIAEFTGIDDGEEEKTINLKLKEDYKNGGFGTVGLAGGTESTYDGKLNYNRFSPQMQAAVIVSGNNINKQAFSFNEYISFMGGIGNAIANNNSGLSFGEFGGGTPQGITDNLSSGLNFNYDFSKKLSLTSHYFYQLSDRNLDQQSSASQFADDITFETVGQSTSDRLNKNHRFQANLKYKPNPYTQISWKNTLSSISNLTTVIGNTEFLQLGLLTGRTTTDHSEDNGQLGIDGRLIFRNRFKKKGRNWINTANYQYGVIDEESSLENQINNIVSSIDIVQNQRYNLEKSGLKVESAYTEPLSTKVFLSGKYGYQLEEESPERLFFDILDEQGILNDELSRSYVKRNIVHNGSVSIRRNAKKLKMTARIGLQSSQIRGVIQDDAASPIEDLNNQSTHALPHARLDIDLSKKASIDLTYNTAVVLPTLEQLAPLPDNTNPNLLRLGNPELVPSYTHRFGVDFRSIDQFNFRNFFANLHFTLVDNQVINALTVEPSLLRILRPINSDSYASLRSYLSYSSPIRPLKIKYSASTRVSWSTYDSFINESLTSVNEVISSLSLNVENRKKEKLDLSTGIDLSLTNRKYDANEDFNQSFFNYSAFVDGVFYIGETWALSSIYDYRFFSGEFFAESQRFHLWHLSVKKSFEQGKFAITLQVNDVLDQTRGVERFGGLNSLSDQRFNTRSRYLNLGVVMKLGKRKKRAGLAL